MNECKVCANADNEYCFACDNGNQFKPMTNADRIRSMTDEELAELIGDNIDCLICKKSVFPADECPRITGSPCYELWAKWLKQEGKRCSDLKNTTQRSTVI